MAEHMVLDSGHSTARRDYCSYHYQLLVVLIGVLRYFISKLMRSFQAPDPKIVKVIIRARNLRSAAISSLSPHLFQQRDPYAWANFFFSEFVGAMDDMQRMMQMSGFGVDPTKSLGTEKDGLLKSETYPAPIHFKSELQVSEWGLAPQSLNN